MNDRLLYALLRSQTDVDSAPEGGEPLVFTGYLNGYQTNAWAVYWRRRCWGPYEAIDGAEKAKALLVEAAREAERAGERFQIEVAQALGLCNEHEGAVEFASQTRLLERLQELQRAWDARQELPCGCSECEGQEHHWLEYVGYQCKHCEAVAPEELVDKLMGLGLPLPEDGLVP